jgi:hypothetical protein
MLSSLIMKRLRFKLNTEQKKETAKLFLGICQVVVLAIIAGKFIPGLEKNFTLYDNVYGTLLIVTSYFAGMLLLKEKK